MERAIFRIIDANFNRAREAVRMVEEFCRFALNSSLLSQQAKQLRHELSTCLNKLDILQLIASRNTLNDVGVGAIVDNQLKRTNLGDSFTAACKRLTEALRVLAEIIQTFNPTVAKTIENEKPDIKTPIKNLFIIGDSVKATGIGFNCALNSARLLVDYISKI